MTNNETLPSVTVRPPVSYFPPGGGDPGIQICPFSTEDLPYFTAFRERLASAGESGNTVALSGMTTPPAAMPPIPRRHPKWGDQLTLVAYRDVSEHDRKILGVAQLYPSAQLAKPHHAEAVILIEQGSRDFGLEAEMMRWLLDLARDVGTRTVEVFDSSRGCESVTSCKRHIHVLDNSVEAICDPTLCRLDVSEDFDK